MRTLATVAFSLATLATALDEETGFNIIGWSTGKAKHRHGADLQYSLFAQSWNVHQLDWHSVWYAVTWLFMLKVLAVIASILVTLSPSASIVKIHKMGSTADLDPFPLVALLFSSIVWCLYGTVGHDPVIFSANIIGVVAGIYFCGAFQSHCTNPFSKSQLLLYYRLYLAILAFEVGSVVVLGVRSLTLLGLCGAASSIVATASPLSCIRTVLRDKSCACMPIEITICCSINAVLWVMCGVVMHNVWILIPNTIACFVGALQISLLVKFHNFDYTPVGKLPSIPEHRMIAGHLPTDKKWMP